MGSRNVPVNERTQLTKLFSEISLQSGRLTLTVNEELSDASWGAWFAEVQHALREGRWKDQNFTHCHLDFRRCNWADPLPLLSIAISLSEFERGGGAVSLEFSPPAQNEQLSDQRYLNHSRLLKFLAREGFLELLWKSAIEAVTGKPADGEARGRQLVIGDEPLTSQMLAELRELPVSLAFERSTCLPATMLLIHAPKDDDDRKPFDALDHWVERKLLEVIEPVVSDMVPGWARSGLRYRLLMLLRECLHNVAEHAYPDSGLAAVYVRYREGALGEAPETWARLRPFIAREYDSWRVPLMQAPSQAEAFPETRPGFFEFFVLDAGVGLCRSLGDCPPKNKSDPVHKCMLDVFRGRSRKDPNRPTRFGGLYLVRQLLEPPRDYVRLRDEDTWWGSTLPLPVTRGGVTARGQFNMKSRGVEHTGHCIEGLSWTARLSWLEPTDDPDRGAPWSGPDEEACGNALTHVFRNAESAAGSQQDLPVHDRRFRQQEYSNLKKFSHDARQVLLWLPEPDQMKNHIQDDLAEILRSGALKAGGTLVIGDIASEEAATYLAAIAGARKLADAPFTDVYRINLVTRHLRVAVLIRDKANLFEASEHAAATFVRAHDTMSESPEQSLADYYRVLRLHDGRRLWETVRNMPDAYLPDPVYWNEGTVLDGYLDFPQSLTHPICRDIYSTTLQRLTGLFPRDNCEMNALDTLVDSLVIRFNATRHPRRHSEHQTSQQPAGSPCLIQIGSVQVSGLTERSERRENAKVFHFFRHRSGTADGCYLLPWLSPPGQPSLLGPEELPPNAYRRVGRTPVVARGGWKAFPVPRFDKNESCIYEQCPRDSYRAWQEPSRTPMKLGHWSYGGHHDLLTLNLLMAFDTELDRISLVLGGSLARFVYANLFRIFDLDERHLNQNGCEIYRAIQKDEQRRPYRHLFGNEIATKQPVLVYPSHPVTDHVVDRFLALVLDSEVERIRKRIHGVLPVRRFRSGSGLQLSGLVVDRLRAVVPKKETRKKPPPVVFFDDALISGRTYEEIKRLLHSLGFQDVYSLVMLDRQRLPSADHVDGKRHLCYWRLDVPTMGGEAHCPLCHAIERAKDFRHNLTSDIHQQRVDTWIRLWSAVNPATQWGDNGLHPIALTLNKYERRFGLKMAADGSGESRQIGDETQQIRLSTTAGLVAWCAELHALTSRDDLALRELQRETLPADVRIQLISSQLLMFSGELDQSLAIELGLQLFQAIWDAKEHDRHTSLAVLTLLGCGRVYLGKVLRSFFQNKRYQAVKERNGDIILLMAIAIHTKAIEDRPDLSVASRLLKANNKPNLYYRLHREIKDTLGKCHSSPLHRLSAAGNDLAVLEPHLFLMNTLASIGQVLAAVTSVPHHWVRFEALTADDLQVITKEIQSLAESIRTSLREAFGPDSPQTKREAEFNAARNKAVVLLMRADRLHAGLFAPLGVVGMKRGEACLLETALRELSASQEAEDGSPRHVAWDDPIEYEFKAFGKPDLEEAYVPWDSEVVEAVRDLITNVRHSSPIALQNPWRRTDTKTAHIWGRIVIEERTLVLEFQNHCDKAAGTIAHRTRLSHSHTIFRELGGDVRYVDEGDDRLITRVLIPYAHTLSAPLEGRH